MAENRKLLFTVNNPKFFISHRIPLAKAAIDAGYEVVIACPPSSGFDELESMGYQMETIYLNRGSRNPFKEIFAIISFYKAVKKVSPLIIHNFTIKPVIYGSLVAKLLKIPKIINTITGAGYIFTNKKMDSALLKPIVSFLYKLAFRGSNVSVIFQNKDDLSYFEKNNYVFETQSKLVRGSGVDIIKFVPTIEPEGVATLLFPGRMLKDKGLIELINCCHELKKEGLNFRLVLAGSIDEANPTHIKESDIHQWTREGIAHWLGEQHDMVNEFQQCHIVCLPSYREGLPLALLEAAASGRPIITTDVPGCRDVVINDVNGLLVPVKKVEPLKDAIKKLVNDPLLRQKMGRAGRERVEKYFTQGIILEQTLNIYNPADPIKKSA